MLISPIFNFDIEDVDGYLPMLFMIVNKVVYIMLSHPDIACVVDN